jgi:hypothetical protein
MNRCRVTVGLSLLVWMGGAVAQAPQDHHPAGYSLVFADEFDGAELNRQLWCTRYIYAGGSSPQMPDAVCQADKRGTLDRLNDERQRYVDTNREGRRLHEVGEGMLSLVATKTGSTTETPYESAVIRSKQSFKPDESRSLYVTARVRLPKVRGTWPAFWINPGPHESTGKLSWPPEIDIFDSPLNEKEDRENMLHVGAVTSSTPKQILDSDPLFNRRWRNYVTPYSLRERWIETAAEWTNDKVCYFVDGVRIMCEAYFWRHRDGREAPPGHVLLSFAIGGSWAGRHGIDDASFPAKFSIDHVRVYEKRL